MVAFLPVLASLVALLGLGQVLKPRLPHYSFRVTEIPFLQWINGNWKTRIGAGVKLQNDNYVPIDVHSLSFDLFYPDWNGDLVHIGQVQDKNQNQQTVTLSKEQQSQSLIIEEESSQSKNKNKNKDHVTGNLSPNTVEKVADSTKKQEVQQSTRIISSSTQQQQPLWEMLPRQSFETMDEVFMEHYNLGHLSVLSSLSWDMIKRRGQLEIPSGGVIQVKANKKLPITMSIICDNALDLWTMEMQGIQCELFNIEVGWGHMTKSIEKLRNQVLIVSGNGSSGGSVTSAVATAAAVSDGNKDHSKKMKKSKLSMDEQLSKWMKKVKWDDVENIEKNTLAVTTTAAA